MGSFLVNNIFFVDRVIVRLISYQVTLRYHFIVKKQLLSVSIVTKMKNFTLVLFRNLQIILVE